ncbi:UNVERIFIED_CONTAM: hypothetical protein Slati_4118600 [Sesamum latifolium]|uniref:Pectinesterase inhibitor domain-containing protein n=1 Tax=Sesamum latifolium TaxID=2727402 RepID=A0AAW2T8S7_9LAMI
MSKFFLFFVFFVLADAETTSKGIRRWCSTVPHPEPCNYFMGRDAGRFDPKTLEDFRAMTIQAAMERAVELKSHVEKLGSKGKSRRKKIVLKDCENLIDSTIVQLNSTLHSIKTNSSFTESDANMAQLSADEHRNLPVRFRRAESLEIQHPDSVG